jgi:hypothetical protein
MPLKDQYGQKLARDVMYYHNRIFKKMDTVLQAILLTPRLTNTGNRFSNTNISANSKPKSERLEM